jgi:hypothetical protein
MRIVLLGLFPLGSVSWILAVMSNCREPYHLRKYAKKEMDGKPLQIAASTPCVIEVMSLWEFSCVFNSLGKLKPE